MYSLFLQIIAITRMNIRSIPQRFWMSLSTIVAVALTVGVLLAFLAMGNGFRQTLNNAGAEDVAIILRSGAEAELNSVVTRDQVQLIEEGPAVAKLNGKPLVSAELYVVVDGKRRSNGLSTNLPLRGLSATGVALRANTKIIKGRMFRAGTNELVVGQAVIKEFSGFDLGNTIHLGGTAWQVVGVFDAGGSVFESEVWGDVGSVQSQFKRLNTYQTTRAKLTSADQLAVLKNFAEKDPRLKLDVKNEKAYYASQANRTNDLIQNLGWPLAIIMAFGALAGALNTMYSSVSVRTAEIGTLRAIGFGGFPTFVGTLIEAMVLAALGGLLGALCVQLFFGGATASSLGGNFTQVVFTFTVTAASVIQAVILALAIGFIGGVFPALRAARQPIAAMVNE